MYSPRTCRKCQRMFDKAADNALSPKEKLFFDKHMASCAICALSYRKILAVKRELGLCQVTAPEDFSSLVMAKIRDCETVQRKKTCRMPSWPAMAGAAIAALLTIGIFGTPFWGMMNCKSSAPSENDSASASHIVFDYERKYGTPQSDTTLKVANVADITLQLSGENAYIYREETLLYSGTALWYGDMLAFQSENAEGRFLLFNGVLLYKEGNLFE